MPYKTQSPDTSEAAERVQFERLRRIGTRQRARESARLTARNWAGMKRALERARPDLSPQQLRVEWVRIQYGEELARRYARWLQAREDENEEGRDVS